MCGIAGVIDKTGRRSPAELGSLAQAMAATMVHRGPDDGGVWIDPQGGCALSHRRLSVIDTSRAGHQPLLSAEGKHVITYNGECYGYRELRAELEAQGERFVSHSDTEVLLAGLVKYGAGLLQRLDAMFAFGLWDRGARRLILARDLFGEKPLYYLDRPDLFAFASELQALTGLPGFDATVTDEAVASYLCWQYVPAPDTIYRAARKLPPGSALTLEVGPRAAAKPVIDKYMVFRAVGPAETRRKPADLADELEAILAATVARRLISDVPLGAFLSGGVDSGLVAALVTRKLKLPLETFSIGFDGHAESEHEAARQTAQFLGTSHFDEVLVPDVIELGRHIGTVLDEPNGDSSCLPTWLLSSFARESVTVALSGDGGDELFGGYRRYFDTLAEAEAPPPGWTAGRAYLSDRILLAPDAVLAELFGMVPPGVAAALAAERGFLDRGEPNRGEQPLLHRLRELDARHYLPGAVLPKVDRMSMQHGLEVRAPLLGIDVARFAAGLAVDACITKGPDGTLQGKALLKRVAQRWLPREWLDRPKRGFGLPMDGWSRATLLPLTRELLLDAEARLPHWIERRALDRFLAAQERQFSPYRVWALFILETWLRCHPAEPAAEPALAPGAGGGFLGRLFGRKRS
jgi:asparagine synthase (glutamine-hydrolysing)